MPSNHRHPAATATVSAPSPPSKVTAKYTNRDGSKVITVPKLPAADMASLSPTTSLPPVATPTVSSNGTFAPQVNRKKQKRREKAAAKKAAAEAAAGTGMLPVQAVSKHTSPSRQSNEDRSSSVDSVDNLSQSIDVSGTGTVTGINGQSQSPHREDTAPVQSKGKKSKKKKKKGASTSNDIASSEYSYGQDKMEATGHATSGRIWDNSSTQERDRIKNFWLGLSEEERRKLVQIEKAAVLKKMKEQQKQTCSCTVCGRKRTAIEEELEGLYDAYYRELEHYATQPPQPVVPSSRFGPISGLPHPHSMPVSTVGRRAQESVTDSRGEEDEEDEVDEDEQEQEEEVVDVYSDAADDGHGYSDDEPGDDHSDRYSAQSFATNFLNFGNNLTVQGKHPSSCTHYCPLHDNHLVLLGGILTVADDLLQNDGRKFIEMMEQLAERRMQREEMHGHYSDHHHHPHHSHHTHNHGPAGTYHHAEDEDDYEDDEDPGEEYEDEGVDDGDYSQDDEFDEEDPEDPMTERERMEEGRRMFQIFAARMFEQRVLKAYRESVSKERSAQLLKEIDEEKKEEEKAKQQKAATAQRRKEKEKERKRRQAEEKQRKEAQKKAEQEAQKAERERQAQEQRAKAEEKRRQKEAKKKAEEDDRLRREAERQRALHEKKEQEERKSREAREAREREKKRKEEQESLERVQREKEAREHKEKQEKAERERKAKAAVAKEKMVKENRKPKHGDKPPPTGPGPNTSVAIPLGPKRPQQNQTPVATPRQSRAVPANFASPLVPVAIPAVPNSATTKIPASNVISTSIPKPRSSTPTISQPLHGQHDPPNPTTPVQASPMPMGMNTGPRTGSGQGMGDTPGHPISPVQPLIGTPTIQSIQFNGPPPLQPGMSFPPGFQTPLAPPPGLMHPHSVPLGGGFRQPPGLGSGPAAGSINMGPPPGLASPTRSFFPPPGFNAPVEPPPGLGQFFGPPVDGSPSSHSRQPSSGFDQSPSTHLPHTCRPAPIGRPASVVAGQCASGQQSSLSGPGELEDEDAHLGSKALLDDDEPLQPAIPLRTNVAPGPIVASRLPFPSGGDPFSSTVFPPGTTWPPPAPNGQFGSSNFGLGGWPTSNGPGFGSPLHHNSITRGGQNRQVAIRQRLCGVCQHLQLTPSADAEGFVPLASVMKEVDSSSGMEPVTQEELDVLLTTEGNRINGGGLFERKDDTSGKKLVRFVHDEGYNVLHGGAVGARGGIGSPLVPRATPADG